MTEHVTTVDKMAIQFGSAIKIPVTPVSTWGHMARDCLNRGRGRGTERGGDSN